MNDELIQTDPGCMSDYDAKSLSVEAAINNILSAIQAVTSVEKVPLRDALTRVLGEDLYSTLNVPAAANSAMDGYAIDSADIPATGSKNLQLIGTSWAGTPFTGSVTPGTCIRIMTGGILPAGADTVVAQENVQRSGDTVTIDTRTRKGESVRAIGEDFRAGDRVLTAGTCIYPAETGLIASLGIGEVKVYRTVRVAFFTTGDELRSVGQSLEEGCIYDSNRYTLHGMLTRLGVNIIDMGVVKDNREDIKKAFLAAADTADVILTSGGVSVGDADFVRETLEEIGEVSFWKVAMKPGRPLAFGKVRQAWFFGLPGNPVSVMVTFYQFVQPALKKLMGTNPDMPLTVRATCTSNLKKRPGRTEYQRGILQKNDNGELTVCKTGDQGSGILSSMTQANCFIVLPVENDGVIAGDSVEVQPFFGMV